MADSTPSNDAPILSESSSFQPTVSLYDWWLIKAENDFEGKRLAVAGVSSRKKEAMRVFVSAPIVKRYDVFSLETADGVHVIISGFINEQRTLENGFAPEVFNSFVFGFPPNWESYALDCHREESKAGTDSGNSAMDNEEGIPSSDNVSTICPEILSDGCFGEESKVGTDPNNAVTDNNEDIPPSDNISTICPENLSDGVEKSVLGKCGKPLPEDECGALKEMSGINVAYGSGRNRRSARLHKHNIKVCQQKKQPATESPPKHPDKDQSSTSTALENCHGLLESTSTHIQSQSKGPLNKSEQLVKKSASRISRTLSEKIEGCNKKKRIAKTEAVSPKRKINKPASSVKSPQETDVSHLDRGSKKKISLVSPEMSSLRKSRSGAEKPIPTSLVLPEEGPENCGKPLPEDECGALKKMSGINVAYGSGRNRRSARLHKHNIKVCQQKKQPATESCTKHPDKDQISTLAASENCDGGLESSSTPTQSQSKGLLNSSSVKSPQETDVSHLDKGSKQKISLVSPESLSLRKSRSGAEKAISTSLVLPEEGPENCGKLLPEDECSALKEMNGINVAYGSGRNRRSARLHKHNIWQQKKQPATESCTKHPDKDQSSTSAALENCDGGMESPSTPTQSQSKGPLNTSEQLVKKSASRISRTLSAKTEGYKKKRRIAKTEAVSPKQKIIKHASSMKSPQERDVSHLDNGSKQKISLVSPETLSLRKSRSGRLLLPPLEYWRNQIPIYNADHEVTEIQEGASLASSSRGSPASLGQYIFHC